MLFFLYGEDPFRSYERVLEIKERFLKNDKSGSGLSSFEADEKKDIMGEIRESYGTPGLFFSKRLAIIKRFLSSGTADAQAGMLDFLKAGGERLLADPDWVAIFWEDGLPKRNGRLFKFLEHDAKKQDFEKLSGLKLEQWIVKRLKEMSPEARISKAAVSNLIEAAGSDSAIIATELEKLFNYCHPEMIDEAAVGLLIRSDSAGSIFETVDALGAGDRKKAAGLVHAQLESGTDPFYVFSMFAYQFRNLLRVNDALEERMTSESDIAKLTHLHPFVVRKSLAQARRFGGFRLRSLYRKLVRLDERAKTGSMDILMALDKFIAEI